MFKNYGVPVETTETLSNAPIYNVELQVSKYNDIRTALRMILPRKWSLNN